MTLLLSNLDGLLWLSVGLTALLLLQRLLHREIQVVLYLLTRQPVLTVALFSIIFLPGILLHELSHWLSARLLFVRTGRFNLVPQVTEDGRLVLGSVETETTDIVRDALIGAAPLVFGMLFVAYAAIDRLHLVVLWDTLRTGQFDLFWLGVTTVPRIGDFWLWFYLTLAVSSTMMPSESDRNTWLPVGLVLAFLLALALVAGTGAWMLQHLAPPVNDFLKASALLVAVTIVLHGLLVVPFLLVHRLLARVLGRDVG